MCGIVGILGKDPAMPILLEGLKRLEYRGYDSAGVALLENGGIQIAKQVGKIAELERVLGNRRFNATTGIAHTRWATHGAPSTDNAHPHVSCDGRIALVHNGIIENFQVLRDRLEKEGHRFVTETDTEVLAHLIEKYYRGDLELAVQEALRHVEGTYGIAVICADEPDKIVGARNGSPLVLGIGTDENLVASDVAAILRHTRQVVYLDDREIAVLTPRGFSTTTIENEQVTKSVEEISWDIDLAEKGDYAHYMLKEIFEQPRTLRDAMSGRLMEDEGCAHLGGLNLSAPEIHSLQRIILTACGTSWHAALIGEYMIEEHARLAAEVEYASELRYRNPVIDDETLLLVISQSGETADTLAAMREVKRKGSKALGICNVVGSTIARESDGGIYIHAGPEIGVASTKAFTSQVAVLAIFTLFIGRARSLSIPQGQEIIRALRQLPKQAEHILEQCDDIRAIAKEYAHHNNFIYLGRGYNFPVALEGALKLKEISYIHAEGYPAAEMKHGPIALIDRNMPVVVIASHDAAYDKIMSNLEEVKAREGNVIAVATEGDELIPKKAHHVITIPPTLPCLTPILSVIPLQLLAYYIAVERGCDVDQPRNLAKSVTVE